MSGTFENDEYVMAQRPEDRRAPWVPISASVLFAISGILFQSLGKAVGVTLAYLGGGLMIRFQREPPDLLKVISPGSNRLLARPKLGSTSRWSWRGASLLIGLLLIALGVITFVLASGS
jgi:hypothetical protein